MIESIFTVSIIGILSGLILSMPIAGPISIIITSNALKGNSRYALRTAMGCASSEFFYVFAAIFGITYLYSTYKPFVPYILIIGSLFLFFVGVKIFRSKLGIDTIEDDSAIKKPKVKGGFRTGIAINLANPSLFVNWLVASFMIFSFASSIGLNVGNLNLIVADNIKEIQNHSDEESLDELNLSQDPEVLNNNSEERDLHSSMILGLLYAGGEAVGTYIWFFILVGLITKYKKKIELKYINILVAILGIILMGMSCFLMYRAVLMI